MKDGHCPMCNSNEVYANPTERFLASNTRVHLAIEGGDVDVSTAFTPYICMNCGFTAMYVKDMKDIQDIPKTKGWMRVGK